MKKIGIDCRFFTHRATGVGRHVFELVQGLAQRDAKNEYVLFLRKEEFDDFEVPAANFTKELTTAAHYSFEEQWHFYKQINTHNFDLMVFPQFNVPLLYTKPYVVTVHDLTLHLFPGKKKTDIISRFAYKLIINTAVRKAKHCFAVSENTKKDMMQYLGLKSEKITVAYNGITQVFSPIMDKKIIQNTNKKFDLKNEYFLYTGVQRSHKNIVGLIHAFYAFIQKHPESKIDLALAGPQNSVYNEVPDAVKELGLEERVHFLGLVSNEDLHAFICGAHAYIFPSFYEGFGIPPIEAMQCGTPVACSHTSSLPEVCGDAVEYFDPYNQKDMVRALEVIAFDEKRREELVKKGSLQCKKFTWEDMVDTMYSVYKKFL